MVRRFGRRGQPAPAPRVPPEVVVALRAQLPSVSEDVIAAVVAEVPSYEDAFSGSMGDTIRGAVQVALGGFLSMLAEPGGEQRRMAPAIEGAYQLGRGEARSGRSSEALLSAYRIGARVAWQRLATIAVEHGLDATGLAEFAGGVFAYIDELSAVSVSGHGDESATAGRVRQRLLDRVARQLLSGESPAAIMSSAERAEWPPPSTLTAVIVPEAQVGSLLQLLHSGTLQASEVPELDDAQLVMVPDAHGRRRGALLRAVEGRGCVVGPDRPWLEVRSSYARALRAWELGLGNDSDTHLAHLVLTADAEALADLRAQVLAPLADLRPATVAKLAETLRAWLLHLGRREEVAASLFVHPQTVRYRMGQLREAYGDRLDDPDFVLAATIALGAEPAGQERPVA